MVHIKRVIDQSDYFVLILGGMYGSVEEDTGKSYTQLEYEYALEIGKPVIRLLRSDPFNSLTGDRIEQDPEKRQKLEAFMADVSATKLCRFWKTDQGLGADVALTLMDMIRVYPAVGWVPGDMAADHEVREENLRLRERLATLEDENTALDKASVLVTYPIISSLMTTRNLPAKDVLQVVKWFAEKRDGDGELPRREFTEVCASVGFGKGETSLLLDAFTLDEVISEHDATASFLKVTSRLFRLLSALRLRSTLEKSNAD